MHISEMDKNFIVNTTLPFDDVEYRNCEEEPFKIYGVIKEGGLFRRMPEQAALSVSGGVHYFHANTSGGRVRFKTDSAYVAIYAKMPRIARLSHFAMTGSSGFDLYFNRDGVETYRGTFVPPFDMEDGYESHVKFLDPGLKEVTINFPLYSHVSDLYIGLQKTAKVLAPDDYRYEKPIVYYGSSVTQGGCASRPGNSYQGIISRRFNANYINLGFSGQCKGEDAMTDYIKNLDMSVFVYDYDYNAPSLEHYQATHEKMFLGIREKHPDLPVIFLSRPRIYLLEGEDKRLEVAQTTYNNALWRGDKNVYFISGRELFSICENNGTVDGCHPNDLGFYSMATMLIDILKDIL